jgi:hypothetical protein
MQIVVIEAGALTFCSNPDGDGRHPASYDITGQIRELGALDTLDGERVVFFVSAEGGAPNCIVESLGRDSLARGTLAIAVQRPDGAFRSIRQPEESLFCLRGSPGTTWADAPVLRLAIPLRK